VDPIAHLDVELSSFESQPRLYVSRVIHLAFLIAGTRTHLSDKDGCVARAYARATQCLPRGRHA